MNQIKKYNIALIPTTKSKIIIDLARQFSNISHTYLLGEKSIPHVTLSHFKAEEKDVYSIWLRVCELLEIKSIKLEFKEYSFIFKKSVFWISLLPEQRDFLKKIKGSKSFDPHMTLINTLQSEYKKIDFSPISDNFILSLGESDSVGQLTKVIYTA